MSEPMPVDQPAAAAGPVKHTERTMLDLLHQRYAQVSQGQSIRYVCAEHVRAGVSFDRGAADFLAQDTWMHKGLPLHGHEVKISRSDWLAELKKPAKAEAIKRYCDRWWLVVSDEGIVRDDLPADWGLMAIRGGVLQVVKRAPKLTPEPRPTSFTASFLRAVSKTCERRGPLLTLMEQSRDHMSKSYYDMLRDRDEWRSRAGRPSLWRWSETASLLERGGVR